MARAYRPLPSTAELWELFSFNPLTGELFWRVRRSSQTRLDVPAGFVDAYGYRSIKLGNFQLRAHRLVWAWVTGADPGAVQIDHKDQNKANNRIWNLRLCSDTQNRANILGMKGWCKANGRFKARLITQGKAVYLGTYDTAEEAHAAYLEARRRLHGDFAA